ncbi:MAG: hypothetical protein ACREER_12900 [Alphaproteobacteria bacterium]
MAKRNNRTTLARTTPAQTAWLEARFDGRIPPGALADDGTGRALAACRGALALHLALLRAALLRDARHGDPTAVAYHLAALDRAVAALGAIATAPGEKRA